MNDFETHPRGTADEIKCSRELAEEIRQLVEQYGPNMLPHTIMQAYNRLQGQYIRQYQMET